MTTITPARRAFLAGLAAVAAPAVVAPAVAATATLSPAELPEILEIGRRLPALLKAARIADAAKVEARAAYESTKPPVPKQLVVGRGEHAWRDTTEDEQDVDGKAATHNGAFPGRMIYRSRNIKAFLIRYDDRLQPDEIKRLRRLARIARKHERADAEALARSGYKDRKADVLRANEALDEQVDRLIELKPLTMAGLFVYARAISACREGFGVYRVDQLGEVLAEGLLRMDADAHAASG